ncbi:hypothetical protein OAP38_03135 [Opitutales bacterium]|nr:hypothetical protein [Opitutales bacterium]
MSILKYEKGYKRFRVQATPKGEDKRIDKERDSEWECHELVQKWERENPNPYNDSEWREKIKIGTAKKLMKGITTIFNSTSGQNSKTELMM